MRAWQGSKVAVGGTGCRTMLGAQCGCAFTREHRPTPQALPTARVQDARIDALEGLRFRVCLGKQAGDRSAVVASFFVRDRRDAGLVQGFGFGDAVDSTASRDCHDR